MGRPKRVLHARGSSSRREPCFINIKRENDVESSFPFRKPEPKKIAERRSHFHAVVAVIATRQSSSKSEEPSCRQASVHEKNFGRARACRGSKRACKRLGAHCERWAPAHPVGRLDSRASTLTGHGAAVVLRDGQLPWQPPRRRRGRSRGERRSAAGRRRRITHIHRR